MISLIRDYIDTLSSILHTSSYSFDVKAKKRVLLKQNADFISR